MLKKISLSLVAIFMSLFLIACGDKAQDQTYADHLSRASVYVDQGQYKAAVIEFKNALKKSKGEADALLPYAAMLNRLGQNAAALTILEQVTGEKSEAYYLELASTYQQLQKYFSADDVIAKHLNSNSDQVTFLLAENALGKGDMDLAERRFDALLTNSEFKNKALLGKASILARKGKVEESLTYIKQVDQTSDSAIKANVLLAGIQISKQKLEEAEATLTNVLSGMRNTDIMEPEKVIVLERLSYVLTRQGRTNEAYIYTKILTEAFPGANEARTQFQVAVEQMDAGKINEAKDTLLQLLASYPNYNKAQQLLGVISYFQGDIQTASKYLSDSVDPEVANDMTRHIYAATNLKLNDPKKVLEILEPGIEQTKSSESLALYGLAAISDKQFEKGEKALLKALSYDQNNVRIRMALASYYRTNPMPDKAKEKVQLDKAYEILPTDKQILSEKLSYILRNDGITQAKSFIDDAMVARPKDYATNLIAGAFLASQQKFELALTHFSTAVSAKPEGQDLVNALFAKGRAQLTLKETASAEQTFKELIKQFPANPLGYRGLLSIAMMKGAYESGIAQLDSLGKESNQLAPYSVAVEAALSRKDLTIAKSYLDKAGKLTGVNEDELKNLGMGVRYTEALMALEVSDFAEARTIVADMLSETPDNLRLLAFLVDLEVRAGQFNEANKIVSQIETLMPDNQVVSVLKGDVAAASKDFITAKTHFEKAWAIAPVDPLGDKLYRAYGLLNDKAAQEKFLGEWLEKIPGSVTATLYQAISYQQSMQKDKAIEAYLSVLKSQPNNAMVLNNLGWIYFETNDEQALPMLKKAAELAPESAAVLDSYGWVLFKKGQKQEGIKYLEKAYKLAPEIEEIKAHLDEAKDN